MPNSARRAQSRPRSFQRAAWCHRRGRSCVSALRPVLPELRSGQTRFQHYRERAESRRRDRLRASQFDGFVESSVGGLAAFRRLFDWFPMANRTKRTFKKVNTIIDALREGLSISSACDRAGIARQTYYDWRAGDPEFVAACESAIEQGTDKLEDIAYHRATRLRDGSDTLLIFLLKARRPERYRETIKQEISGPGGGAIPIRSVVVPLPQRADE